MSLVLVVKCSKLCPVPEGKLAENRADVVSDGSFTEKECLSNFTVATAVCDQADHLIFPITDVICQIGKRGSVSSLAVISLPNTV